LTCPSDNSLNFESWYPLTPTPLVVGPLSESTWRKPENLHGENQKTKWKVLKVLDGEQNTTSIDRLSSLPDDVICHILSSLPTKLSMATSVLGERWRFLRAHVPCLHFSDDDFRKEGFWEEETQASDDFREEGTQASDIMSRGYIAALLKLDLYFVVVESKIGQMELRDSMDQTTDLIDDSTFLNLSFSYGECHSLLKKFYVSNLLCENDDALPRFLSGCPSLDELNMAICFRYDYVTCINISSPTIKILMLDIDYLFGPPNTEDRMIINAPTLRYLQVHGYGFPLEWMTIPITMNSLVEADIHIVRSYMSKWIAIPWR
ncbi:F-box/RNI-like superfamily protein, partial [Striga asiatica]